MSAPRTRKVSNTGFCTENSTKVYKKTVFLPKVYKKTVFLRPVNKKVKTATIFVVKTRSQVFPILICPTGLVSQ